MITARAYALGMLLAGFAFRTQGAVEFRVHGGRVEGDGTLEMDRLILDAGAELRGNFLIRGHGDIHGVVTPGVESYTNAVAIHFSTSVVFHVGSALNLSVTSTGSVDRLVAGGPVSGVCELKVRKNGSGAPLWQVVVDGGAGSDYDMFYLDDSSTTNYMLSSEPVGNLLITDKHTDLDGDGLPDYWEVVHFGGRTNGLASADDDWDGMNNWAEFIAGTNPTNAASRLALEWVEAVGPTNLVVAWSSVSGRYYSLLRMTNVTDRNPVVVASGIAAMPPLNRYTNKVAEWDCYYYRIRVDP